MYIYSFFFHGSTALVGLDLLREIPPSHTDTPQSVGFLWTSDRPISKPFNWQHTTLATDRQTDFHVPRPINCTEGPIRTAN